MKTLDLTKFRKDITKSLSGVSVGFKNPNTWISFDHYLTNWLVSGDFHKGFPLGKVGILAGEPGSGKSYFCANIIRNALKENTLVIVLDSEEALDEKWLGDLGIDVNDPNLLRFSISMVNHAAEIISRFLESYKEQNDKLPDSEKQKVLFVIDSLGFLNVPSMIDQVERGEIKGDMGHKPKALKALVSYCVSAFGQHNIGLLCTNHTMASQDMFNPDPKISGGDGPIYAASIVLGLSKRKLKDDEKKIAGITTKVVQRKSRFNHKGFFQVVEVDIPFATGMSPYSGLVTFFEDKGLLVKSGNRLKYTDKTGNEHLYYRKDIPNSLLDLIMQEFSIDSILTDPEETVPEPSTEIIHDE